MIRNKLKSNTGASLSMALFLFLICTVASAVILTAATVAAGRAAAVDEMDARYYAVSSAAELLAKELSGKTVTITRVKTETSIVTTNWNADGAYQGSSREDKAATVETTPDSPADFLTAEAFRLMFGSFAEYNTEPAMTYSFSDGKGHDALPLSLTHDGAPTGADLDLSGSKTTVTLKADGTMELSLEKDGYQLLMTMTPEINEKTGTARESSTEATVNDDNSSVEVTTTITKTTKTSTIRWTVDSIRKVVASAT
ncbi:MAG: hypothetical protein E7427_10275 [Ruminococcaceae bacterium]|jgi:hypothetical protein|nr:hypothetical protein [Oscillospiraceae bacterium]